MPRLINKLRRNYQTSQREYIAGFTLIELLVAISIVAILAVIGMVLFSNAQVSARDAKRRGDVDAIAAALEQNYDSTTGTYPAPVATWFAAGAIPKDPKASAYGAGPKTCGPKGTGYDSQCNYCFNLIDMAFGACTVADGYLGISDFGVPTQWKICANLEGGAADQQFYCKRSTR